MTKTNKKKFVREYPINASAKLLYPYLTTPGGLAQWFCDDVKIDENKNFIFVWDKGSHYAEMSGYRVNRGVRFIFLDENKNHVRDASYIDFSIESSELTQEQYLKVVDYSEEEDEEQWDEMWDGLIQKLRETVGG